MGKVFLCQLKGGLKQLARDSRVQFFFFIWYIVVLVFFSLSGSKLATYILPMIPALAVCVALWCASNFFGVEFTERDRYRSSVKSIKVMLFLIWIVGVIALIGGGLFVVHTNLPTHNFNIAIAGVLIFVVSGLYAFISFSPTHKPRNSLVALSLGWILLLILILPATDGILSYRRSTKSLCAKALPLMDVSDKVYISRKRIPSSAIFYLKRRIERIKSRTQAIEKLKQEPGIFIIVDSDEVSKFLESSENVRLIAKGRKYAIVTNKKQ